MITNLFEDAYEYDSDSDDIFNYGGSKNVYNIEYYFEKPMKLKTAQIKPAYQVKFSAILEKTTPADRVTRARRQVRPNFERRFRVATVLRRRARSRARSLVVERNARKTGTKNQSPG